MQSVKCKATSRAGLSRASGSSGSGARLHRLHSGPAGRHSGSARDQDWAGKSETKLSVGATILQCQLGLAEMTDIVPGQWQCLSDGQNMTWGARGTARSTFDTLVKHRWILTHHLLVDIFFQYFSLVIWTLENLSFSILAFWCRFGDGSNVIINVTFTPFQNGSAFARSCMWVWAAQIWFVSFLWLFFVYITWVSYKQNL